MPACPEWYQLRDLIQRKEFEGAAALIANTPSLVSATNVMGETVLHYQAVENDEAGVSWLSSRGFDINTRNAFGVPVVFEVAQLDYKELLNWFIAKGADLKSRDDDGRNIREYLLDFKHEDIARYIESLGF